MKWNIGHFLHLSAKSLAEFLQKLRLFGQAFERVVDRFGVMLVHFGIVWASVCGGFMFYFEWGDEGLVGWDSR